MCASKVAVVLVLLAVGIVTALGAWPPDPAANLAVADRPSEQIIPKVIAGPDGSCCIGWFDRASGNYDVYLQLLDPLGNEVGPHNGLLISDHAQDTWLCDWDLMADSSGNAVLTFVDLRAGGDWDVYVYRVSPAGEFLWGADGVTVTDTPEHEVNPQVTETSDGSFIVIWEGDALIGIQKLLADGTPAFGPTGLVIKGDPGEMPGFARVVPADNGGFIVSWMRDLNFSGFHHIRAQKFAADGTALWPAPVAVFDADWIPPWYRSTLLPDGAGGAIVGWHRSANNLYNSSVQHLDADGNELFPHNGVAVCDQGSGHHMDPAFLHDQATGEILVFWSEQDFGQSQRGIYGQKFSANGQRQWTDAGAELAPVNTIEKSSPRGVPCGDGAMVFWFDRPGGGDRVVGARVDAKGGLTWPDSPRVFSSADSGKSRLPIAAAPNGMAILVWEDDRNGEADIYAQNANLNGSLGVIGDVSCDGELSFGDINPFVLALTNPAGYAAAFPDCDIMLADINCDGVANFGDINPFVRLLTGP